MTTPNPATVEKARRLVVEPGRCMKPHHFTLCRTNVDDLARRIAEMVEAEKSIAYLRGSADQAEGNEP